jgi:hypothetical protein
MVPARPPKAKERTLETAIATRTTTSTLPKARIVRVLAGTGIEALV